MIKKFFFLYCLLNLINYCYAGQVFEIIVNVNNRSITATDLANEVKILNILNKNKTINIDKKIALNNLIDEIIKKEEIIKEKLKIDDKEINKYFLTLLKNLNINENEIEKKLILLIKEKIKIENLWNDLIIKKYSWKISVNMNEIEQKIEKEFKDKNNLDEIKQQIILNEKNKKLAVFSKYHLNILKKESLIKFRR